MYPFFKDTAAAGASSSFFSSVVTKTSDQTLNYQYYSQPPMPTSVSSSSFPILAIILLSIVAIAFLLLSYYLFVIKCCLNWQQLTPAVLTQFAHTPPRRSSEDLLMAYNSSAAVETNRGLDEFLIRNIPTLQYKADGSCHRGDRSFRGCAVCLSEFQDQEILRVLPRCNHVFHLDCIDVWLLNNASCPLCRSSISGLRTKNYPAGVIDHIIAPTSSPQDMASSAHSSRSIQDGGDGGGGTGEEEGDYVVIELSQVAAGAREQQWQQQRRVDEAGTVSRGLSLFHSQKKILIGGSRNRKEGRNFATSFMGDECINVIRDKDEQFSSIQPIRRSFSMDSAADRELYLQVQDNIIRQENSNRIIDERVSGSSEQNSSVGRGTRRSRSFFTIGGGGGRQSRSAVLPLRSNLSLSSN